MNYGFIGWLKEDNHDKVWVTFEQDGSWYAGWGRRGKKLQFKQHNTRPYKLEDGKMRKGYRSVDDFTLFAMFPNFEEDVQEQLFIKTLSGNVR